MPVCMCVCVEGGPLCECMQVTDSTEVVSKSKGADTDRPKVLPMYVCLMSHKSNCWYHINWTKIHWLPYAVMCKSTCPINKSWQRSHSHRIFASVDFLIFLASGWEKCAASIGTIYFFLGHPESAKYSPDRNCASHSSHKIVWKLTYVWKWCHWIKNIKSPWKLPISV